MVYLYLEVVGAVCCLNVLGEYGSRVLYRDISSGGNSTTRCIFGCLDRLASGELSSLFLLKLAMLTTVVLEAESSVVRDTLLVLVVLVRLMLLLGSLDLDNWDHASPPRLVRLNRVDNDWEVCVW